VAKYEHERDQAATPLKRSVATGLVDALRSTDLPKVSSLQQLDSGYRAGFVGGLVQAEMLRRGGALSDRLALASSVYGAAIAEDKLLRRLERGAGQILSVHTYGIGAASLDGFEVTTDEDLAMLLWVASLARLELPAEVLASHTLSRAAEEALRARLRAFMESRFGPLSRELTIACAAYRLALRSEKAKSLLASPAGVGAAHRHAWAQVETLGLPVSTEEEAALSEWLAAEMAVPEAL
jgi:hypothetical protein